MQVKRISDYRRKDDKPSRLSAEWREGVLLQAQELCGLLLVHVAEDLVTVLLAVGSTADMDPVVATVRGLHDQLVEVGVMLQEVEPLLCELHVGVALVVIPIGVGVELLTAPRTLAAMVTRIVLTTSNR